MKEKNEVRSLFSKYLIAGVFGESRLLLVS